MQLATLTGHTYRVLYLAISPDGQVFQFFHLILILDYWVCMTKKIFFLSSMLYSWLCWVLFQTIVTGAGDETLRFWNVFPSPKSQVNYSLNDGEKSCPIHWSCQFRFLNISLLFLEIWLESEVTLIHFTSFLEGLQYHFLFLSIFVVWETFNYKLLCIHEDVPFTVLCLFILC